MKRYFRTTSMKPSVFLEGPFQNIYFFVFYGIVELFCELHHKFFINLRLRQKINLWSSALFSKDLHSAAVKIIHSAACGSTYAPLSSCKKSAQFID